ncbi:MAG: HAMP domain-containing protein [Anaerotruncus massiliensis (ex Togo et al. 2019)]
MGIPVKTESGVPAAVIFASASAGTLTVFLKEILKMFIISSLAVLILAFAAVYFITADLVRPLRKMVAATRALKGDFTVRVPVESYDEIGQLAISFNNMATSLATTEWRAAPSPPTSPMSCARR